MNLEHLKQNYPKLLNYMKDKGYSGEAYYCTKTTIELILRTDSPSWKDYDDVREDLHKVFPSKNAWARRTAALNRIICFDLFGEFPNWERHPQLDQLSDYYQLVPDYRKLVDEYKSNLQHLSLSESTIYRRCISISSLLLRLQEKQIFSFSDISEESIVLLFWNDGKPFGKTYREVFKNFLKRITSLPEQLREIISAYVPKGRNAIKNKQYLSETEVEAVRAVLRSDTQLSLRDRAIGSLLFYTGLRAVDICNLKLSDIDWSKDEISIIQKKTDVPLKLPLDAVYGNLIYDYIQSERPETDDLHVFVSSRRPFVKLGNSAISSRIASNIFDAAHVRMKSGEQRGSHIFRHHLVSAMLEHENTQVAISSVLGHSSASSIQPYLNTDFPHLKECALSLEDYPVSEEAYSV